MSKKQKQRTRQDENSAAPDPWYRQLEEAVAEIDPEDERRMHEAIHEVRRQAKEQARREMELP